MPALAHRMTVAEAEALLAGADISLRRLRFVRDESGGRWVAACATAGDLSGLTFEASGTDLENLVENAVAAARRRPARPGGVRRWRS